MRVMRAVRWSAAFVLLGLVVSAGILYLYASGRPAEYQPAQLTQAERQQAAGDFIQRIIDFDNAAAANLPFTWTITQDTINRALASVDEIQEATSMQPGQAGEFYKTMEQLGMAEPAVAIGDGMLTLFVRLREYNKIVSAEISVEITDDGLLRVRLGTTRLGKLAMSDSMARKWLEGFQGSLAERMNKGNSSATKSASHPRGVNSDEIATGTAALVAAIDGPPVVPTLTCPMSRRHVRIESVHIADKKITIRVVPAVDRVVDKSAEPLLP